MPKRLMGDLCTCIEPRVEPHTEPYTKPHTKPHTKSHTDFHTELHTEIHTKIPPLYQPNAKVSWRGSPTATLEDLSAQLWGPNGMILERCGILEY